MSDKDWAALVGLAVYLALRAVDYLLPKGRHFRFIDRWIVRDDTDEERGEHRDGA